MRKVIELQMKFWKKDISQIKFNLKSRDEIPKLLMDYSTYTVLQELDKKDEFKFQVHHKSHVS